jgi:anti-sigma-K factor RskA
VHDLAEAFALDALGPDERQVVEEHLSDCDGCAADVARAQRVAGQLASVLEPREPSIGHLARFQARLAAEDRPSHAALPTAGHRRGFRWSLRQALSLAAAAVLVIALGGWSLHLQQELVYQQQVANVAIRADARDLSPSLVAGDALGRAFVDPSTNQVLISVNQFPELSAGRTYQLWFTRADRQLDSGGTFGVSNDGSGVILATAPAGMGAYVGVGITTEPSGGSPAPTAPMLMYWNLPGQSDDAH